MTDGVNIDIQLLGSIASLVAIPLSVYLYLRSRESLVASLRREIARILSYQIGEGRDLSVFELQAVIDSNVSKHGLRASSISTDEMIEDLVTETITNPMLQRDRKGEIIRNLRLLHGRGATYALMEKYLIDEKQLLYFLSVHHLIAPEDADQAERALARPESIAPSALFAIIAVLLTMGFLFILLKLLKTTLLLTGLDLPVFELFLGVLISVIAGFIVDWAFRRRRGLATGGKRTGSEHDKR